jgi:lysozyme
MDLPLTKQWISRWEGIRTQVYKDTMGIPTIGVGLNLTTPAARTAVAALGLDCDALIAGTISLTDEQVDTLLGGSIDIALVTARKLVSNFDTLPEPQQIVITDLAFNMGGPTLSQFVHTLALIQAQNWADAARNLQQSNWFKQVGIKPNQRGGADSAVLANSCTPQSVLGLP